MFEPIRFPIVAVLAALLGACGGGGGGGGGNAAPQAPFTTPGVGAQRYQGSWVGLCKNTPAAASKSQGELITVVVGRDGSARLTRELRRYADPDCQNAAASSTTTDHVFTLVDTVTIGNDAVDRAVLIDQATGTETRRLLRLKDGQWVESQPSTDGSYPTQLDTSNRFLPVLASAVDSPADRYLNTRWVSDCYDFGNNQWARAAFTVGGRAGDVLQVDERFDRYSDHACAAAVASNVVSQVMRFGHPVQWNGETMDRARIHAHAQSPVVEGTALLLRRADVLFRSDPANTSAWDAEGYPTEVNLSLPYRKAN